MPRRSIKRRTPGTNFTADSVGPQPGCGGARDIRPWKSPGQNRLMKTVAHGQRRGEHDPEVSDANPG